VFQTPSFAFWNVAFTAIGAAVYWGKWGRTKLKAYVLSDLVNLIPVEEKWRFAIEFAIFLIIGSVVGIAVVQPTNATQALTAGFGWTGLFAHRVQ
jgi:hypothetical protein